MHYMDTAIVLSAIALFLLVIRLDEKRAQRKSLENKGKSRV